MIRQLPVFFLGFSLSPEAFGLLVLIGAARVLMGLTFVCHAQSFS